MLMRNTFCLFGWLVGWVFGISTFAGYLILDPFLCKLTVLFQTLQFSISTHLIVKGISIQFSQTVLFETIQFSKGINFCLHS